LQAIEKLAGLRTADFKAGHKGKIEEPDAGARCTLFGKRIAE